MFVPNPQSRIFSQHWNRKHSSYNELTLATSGYHCELSIVDQLIVEYPLQGLCKTYDNLFLEVRQDNSCITIHRHSNSALIILFKEEEEDRPLPPSLFLESFSVLLLFSLLSFFRSLLSSSLLFLLLFLVLLLLLLILLTAYLLKFRNSPSILLIEIKMNRIDGLE